MKMKRIEQPTHPYSVFVEDPLPTAFVTVYDPTLSAIAEPSYSGRVTFRIIGDADRIRAAFQALSDDHPIGARSLIDAIKKLRTEMFRVKAAGQGVPRG